MQFLGFTGDGIEQQDSVFNTSADVDVCQSICNLGGDLVDIEFEQFTETHANAVFMNMGASPILLDKYIVSIPGSGIPNQTVVTSAILPGGTCSNSPSTQCATDANCGIAGNCEHVETTVEILLYSFVTKELVRGDKECPRLDFENNTVIPGNVTPVTYQTNVTFSGSDASGERFTIKTGLVGGFFDANNCSDSSGGGGG
ncbi:MAG: hypothetical protein SF182_21115 [Deltaproteobacteria bacterium]|nr:hypothetical protein [Deltaproteobacteria bacterium]